MTSIETFCYLLDVLSRDNRNGTQRQLTLEASNNTIRCCQKQFKFSKVITGDFISDCSNLLNKQHDSLVEDFLNGFNVAMLLHGCLDSLTSVVTGMKNKNMGVTGNKYSAVAAKKNFVVNILEKVMSISMRQSKKTKRFPSIFSLTSNSSNSKIRNDLTLKVYSIGRKGNINDLILKESPASPTSESAIQARFVQDSLDGCVVKNVIEQPIHETHRKETARLLTNLTAEYCAQKKNCGGVLIVEFSQKKFTEGDEKPTQSRLFCIIIPSMMEQMEGTGQEDEGELTEMLHDVLTKCSRKNVELTERTYQEPLNEWFSELIGGNFVMKTVACININQSDGLNLKTLELSSLFNQIECYPVRNTPQVKAFLQHSRKQMQEFRATSMKEQKKNIMELQKVTEKLWSSQIALQKMTNEKNALETFAREVQEKNAELLNLDAENSNKSFSLTEEKLQLTKDFVDLQLEGNLIQQEAKKTIIELKNKLLHEEKKCEQLSRDLQFESRLHGDLKHKYERLKTSNNDLNDEYVNLKLNFHDVTEEMEGQVKVINELKKKVNQLLEMRGEFISNTSEVQVRQDKKFKEELQKLSSLLSDIPDQRKEYPWEKTKLKVEMKDVGGNEACVFGEGGNFKGMSEHTKELKALERKLFSVKKELSNKDEIIAQCKYNLAELSTNFSLVQEENESLQKRAQEAESVFKRLSQQYQERLQEYVRNINDYIQCFVTENEETNETDKISRPELIQVEASRMLQDYKASINDDREQMEERIKDLSKRNELLVGKLKKTTIAYRLSLNNNTDGMDEMCTVHLELPDDTYVGDYQMEEIRKMQLKIKEIEDENVKLKAQTYHKEKSVCSKNNGDFEGNSAWEKVKEQIQKQSKRMQQTLEREKADLLTRCLLAEQQLTSYKQIMEQQVASYEEEIHYLEDVLEAGRHCDKPFEQNSFQQSPRHRGNLRAIEGSKSNLPYRRIWSANGSNRFLHYSNHFHRR